MPKPIPRRVEVDDYHEFDDLQDKLRMVDSSVKVKEVAFNPITGMYLGVMYRGRLTSPRTKKIVKELKNESKDAFERIIGY